MAFAADAADVPLDALGSSLEKFAKNTASAANGSAQQAAAFQAMGIGVKAADGSIRPMNDLLSQIAEKFSGYRDGIEKTTLAQALFGKSGAAMVPLLNQGAEGLKKAAEEAKAYGFEFGDIAEDSERFNDNLKTMGAAAVGLGADIARELLPSLLSAEEKILDFVKSARESGAIQKFAGAVGTVAENFDKIATVIGARLAFSALASGITAASVAMQSLAGSTTLAAGSFTLLKGEILSAKTGLGVVTAAAAGWEFGKYLEENFLQAKLAGIALVDGLMTAWETIKSTSELVWLGIEKGVIDSINAIRNKVADLFDAYANVAQRDIFTGKLVDDAWAVDLANKIRPASMFASPHGDAFGCLTTVVLWQSAPPNFDQQKTRSMAGLFRLSVTT